ncbi:MAG: hypothetical protein KHY89_07015 [Butyricicoccus pullicaecorum]|nr:hypothetical protein [Butyricicoccus pullicaecorum]
MKYCYKCGNPMEDDMLFCQKCGTRASNDTVPTPKAPDPAAQEVELKQVHTPTNQVKTAPANNNEKANNLISLRKGMRIWMIVCIVFAGLYMLIGTMYGEAGMAVGMGGFFAILAAMFFILAKSPKGNPYILNRQSGLKKKIFVLICVVIAYVVVGIGISTSSSITTQDGENQHASQPVSTDKQKNEISQDSSTDTVTTLSDIQKWYENQIPAVSQSLVDYAKSVNGLTLLNVDSSKFRFGENNGWYDCHYTFMFTCVINGTTYNGEARAFMKYQDATVNWFHFEIFSNTDVQSLVEHYDDSYDQIIEDYYKELESLYQ